MKNLPIQKKKRNKKGSKNIYLNIAQVVVIMLSITLLVSFIYQSGERPEVIGVAETFKKD